MLDVFHIEPISYNYHESLMTRQRRLMTKIIQVLNTISVTSIETSIDIYSILTSFSSFNYVDNLYGKFIGVDVSVNIELKNNQIVFRNDNFKTYEEFIDGDYILELYGDIGF